MPMGVVSDDDFNKEIVNSGLKPSATNPNEQSRVPINPTGFVIDINDGKGRGNGNVAVPDSLRSLIAETAIVDGRAAALQLAESMGGISPSSVSAYTNGVHSTASYNDKKDELIVDTVQKSKDNIAIKARNTLRKALSHITSDKLEGANVKDLAGVAKDMAVISKSMEGEKVKDTGNNGPVAPQFVVYAPQFIQENTFEVVHARDNY